MEQSKISPLISVISPGQEHYGIFLEGQCLGYYKGSLDIEKEQPRYLGAGEFLVSFQGEKIISELNFEAQFASYYKLEQLTGRVRAGVGDLNFRMDSQNEEVVEVKMKLGQIERELTLPSPQPVFLQPSGEKYSLRFPRNIENNLIKYLNTSLSSAIPKSSEGKMLSRSETELCM